jgi:hypothetical protein
LSAFKHVGYAYLFTSGTEQLGLYHKLGKQRLRAREDQSDYRLDDRGSIPVRGKGLFL